MFLQGDRRNHIDSYRHGNVLGVSKVGLERRRRGYETELAKEIIAMHRYPLSQGQMTGIASSNEHVVKQWFDGRLEFAVPVRDFADEGFALQGGRLDETEGRSVAAVVYEGSGHHINLFMWPAEEPDRSPHAGSLEKSQWIYWLPHMLSQRGFALAQGEQIQVIELAAKKYTHQRRPMLKRVSKFDSKLPPLTMITIALQI